MPLDEGNAYYEKAMADIKLRTKLDEMRPPKVWNFFEDKPQTERVSHVLRYNANPAQCYKDGRIEGILKNVEEIGMNLSKYEETKWKTLRKHTMAVFANEFSEFKKALDEAG